MTRRKQQDDEKGHVRNFFRILLSGNDTGLLVDDRNPPEPDIYVQCDRLCDLAIEGSESIYVEVTEYHPIANGQGGFLRTEIDSRWQKQLLPTIDAARRANDAMVGISASFDFKEARLPKSREHRAIAVALVAAVEAALPRILSGQSIRVWFLPRDSVVRLPKYVGDDTFLASEDFPLAAEHFSVIRLTAYPNWKWPPPWDCPRLMGGWNSPSADEFANILNSKEKKAKKYVTQGRAIWLLIVTDLPNDLESHVFPQDDEDVRYLREQITATGFDFAMGAFQQVWLYSQFSQQCVRLDQTSVKIPKSVGH